VSSLVSSLTGGETGNSGGAGVNYKADGTPLQTPTTVDQANNAYTQAQSGLSQQQNFLNAVNAQNGLGNQSAVYNQLQGVANGTGPNPAQAQLAQATGANVANQASLMAGQRGANQNVGLIARQAAQQGASTQQQAAGQAATLQANQSLNALNSMGSLATNQANQQANATGAYTNATQAEQSNILNGIQGQNQAAVGSVGSQNSANAGVANTVAGGQMSLIGNMAGGLGSALSLAQGGKVPQMMAGGGAASTPLVQSQGATSGPQSAAGKFFSSQSSGGGGSSSASQGAAAMGQAGAAIGKGIGTGISALGGLFSSSGAPASASPFGSSSDTNSIQAQNNAAFQNGSDGALGTMQGIQDAVPSNTSPLASLGGDLALGAGGGLAQQALGFVAANPEILAAARGGKVPALLSPGERYLSPGKVQQVVNQGADPMKVGKKVPGKPKVDGAKNSYANDTVPADLDQGGVVVPRSITKSKSPSAKSIAFVHAIAAKHGMSVVPSKKGK
jgi:hypothetical protein